MAREFEKAVELLSLHFNVDEAEAKKLVEYAFTKAENAGADVCLDDENSLNYHHEIKLPYPGCFTPTNLETDTKPPIGLIPKHIISEQRLRDIDSAIERYMEVKRSIPIEWIEERNELIKHLNDRRG
ncbi:MAG: hypothetical protein ABTA16_00015 [Niallia sp.]